MKVEYRRFGDLLAEPMRNGVYKPTAFHGRGAKVINMKELFAYDRIDDQGSDRVDLSAGELDKWRVVTGDLLFARRSFVLQGSGKCSIIGNPTEDTTFESSMIRARLDRRHALPRFIYYVFASPIGRARMASIATQTAVSGITGASLRELSIPVPPLPVQSKVVAILSAYDDLIENHNRRIKILEELAQRIYREWFVDFRYPGHEIVPLVDSELGPVPKGWSVKPLSELAHVTMGQSPPSSAYNRNDNGLPFHQGVGTYGAHFPRHDVYSTAGDRTADAGDTLVSVRAPVGRINIADRRLILGRGLCGIRGGTTPNGFLLFALKHFFRDEDVMGNGSIFKAVRRRDVEGLGLTWPGPALACSFALASDPIVEEIRVATVAVENLRSTRDLLLPRLISGETDVDDLDISMPDVAA